MKPIWYFIFIAALSIQPVQAEVEFEFRLIKPDRHILMTRHFVDFEACRKARETLLTAFELIGKPGYYVTCTPENLL